MEKTLSLEELKQILFDYLKKNKFLKLLFSDSQIKDRLEANLEKLLVEDKREDALGGYNFEEKSITLYLGKNITAKEILENENLLTTILHEGIHSVLRNKFGTGLFYFRPKLDENIQKIILPESEFEELGRGLNEGVTNWIVRQSGVETISYNNLTEITELIASCIGTKRMKPFTSDNYKKIFKALHMSRDYGMEFLRQLDEVYYIEENLRDINNLAKYFQEIQKLLQTEDRQEFAELEKKYGYLRNKRIYNQVINEARGEELNKIIRDIDTKTKESSIIERFSSILNEIIGELEQKYQISETARRNYLITSLIEKILKSLVKDRLDEPETISDYKQVSDIINRIRDLITENEITGNLNYLDDFLQKIGNRSNDAVRKILEEAKEDSRQGNISAQLLEDNIERLKVLYSLDTDPDAVGAGLGNLIHLVTKNNEFPEEQKALIKYAIYTKSVKDLRILQTITTKSGKHIILKGSQIIGVLDDKRNNYEYMQAKKSFRVNQGESYLDKADWTVSMDTDMNILARQFEEIKRKELMKDPKVETYILEGIIAFKNQKGYSFYEVTQGKDARIQPAQFTTTKFIKSMVKERKPNTKDTILPIQAKNGIITKIKRKISFAKAFLKSRREGKTKEKREGTIATGIKKNNEPNFQTNLRNDFLKSRNQSREITYPEKKTKENNVKETLDEER